ncbi:hypothetical protein NDU88_008689 [Pleurodeles waltl]|uniref:Uncharacterized protein n=1 Tax=Pleurodeles waltl TaxID=8319 RepID=A0AAV7NYI9_PLEWA|nr:hypothetical protein NDU88_008689 [Pleurodeles waltl]
MHTQLGLQAGCGSQHRPPVSGGVGAPSPAAVTSHGGRRTREPAPAGLRLQEAAPWQDSPVRRCCPKMSSAGRRSIPVPRAKSDLSWPVPRARRGPELQHRVAEDVTRHTQRACRPSPRARNRQPSQTPAARRADLASWEPESPISGIAGAQGKEVLVRCKLRSQQLRSVCMPGWFIGRRLLGFSRTLKRSSHVWT